MVRAQNHSQDEFAPAAMTQGEMGSMNCHPCYTSLHIESSNPDTASHSIPLEPSMSYVHSKILSRRMQEDDIQLRQAKMQLLTDTAVIRRLTLEQCLVVHHFLIHRMKRTQVPDLASDTMCLGVLRDAHIQQHSPNIQLDSTHSNSTFKYELILKVRETS
eukprot:Gregarina_sp_Poly_1__386@NODE_1097_length_5104_cov_220_281318_g761_i0_p4_GENE_NODE_1097_length_5104_cov_220_281318_g761_i0NODE_1097_length_5104_cov_220_281318_g761_i0_p4_ORF_typecomplete_len160_score16_29_NODE_1097_length_5104_cov_220_281318_g761_i016842163